MGVVVGLAQDYSYLQCFTDLVPPAVLDMSSGEKGIKGTAMLCSGPISCCTGWGWCSLAPSPYPHVKNGLVHQVQILGLDGSEYVT